MDKNKRKHAHSATKHLAGQVPKSLVAKLFMWKSYGAIFNKYIVGEVDEKEIIPVKNCTTTSMVARNISSYR
jgi:hypothetical protein